MQRREPSLGVFSVPVCSLGHAGGSVWLPQAHAQPALTSSHFLVLGLHL